MLRRILFAAAMAAVVAMLVLHNADATVTTTASTVSYTGDGSTATFTVPFRFLSTSDLVVSVGGVTKVLTTDYTVTGVSAAAGGSVTFVVAPAAASAVVIKRAVAYTQPTPLAGQGPYRPETIERISDRLEMQIQQLANGDAGTLLVGGSTFIGSPAIIVQNNGANRGTVYVTPQASDALAPFEGDFWFSNHVMRFWGSVRGNGTGTSTAGVIGGGSSPNGVGVTGQGVGSGAGVSGTSAGTGPGVSGTGGSSSGIGGNFTGGSPNGFGVQGVGTGTGPGVYGTGGTSNAPGVLGAGGATNGQGVQGAGTGTGVGVQGTGGSTDATGVVGIGGGNGNGVTATGSGTGAGLIATSGGSGSSPAVTATAANAGSGVAATGGPTGTGVLATSGATGGYGVQIIQNNTAKAHLNLQTVTSDPSTPTNGDVWISGAAAANLKTRLNSVTYQVAPLKAGTIALTSGTPSTATVTLPITGMVCTCTNTANTANSALKCNVATTSLTITGPNSITDLIAYTCMVAQ